METGNLLDIVIASANPLLLDGLRSLQALGNCHIVGEGREPNGTHRLVELYRPRALVADLDLFLQASSLLQECRQSRPSLKFIVLEGPVDVVHSFTPLEQPDAFVPRTSALAALARVIQSTCSPSI